MTDPPKPPREPVESFDAAWLALREPADNRARAAGLLASLGARLRGREAVSIVDLGCGTGSNLRATAPALPVSRQMWTLVDHDERLLAAARDALAAWADDAQDAGEELVLGKDGRVLVVDFRRIDLMADVERAVGWQPDLLTAAAFFDLAAVAWIERVARACARRGVPLYAALTYDGREEWAPPHPLDADVHAAFLAHQNTDKGFGPAAGAGAGEALRRAFEALGFDVETADSPWSLRADEAEMIALLADGIAQAAAESGLIGRAEAQAWAAARRNASATIGHVDVLAWPPERERRRA